MIPASVLAGELGAWDSSGDELAEKSRELILMLLEHNDAPYSRETFKPGHITATACVLAPEGDAMLLIHHKRLDRWLMPGGHVEVEDAHPRDGAAREAVEETGVVLAEGLGLLAGMDVHGIPGKKKEPYHLHHDLVYAFRAASRECMVTEETRGVAWARPEEWDRYGVPENSRRCFRRAIFF